MSEELKPCPFCGGIKAFLRSENPESGDYNLVFCPECEASAYIDIWARRANSPNKHEQALLDVLRNKLCDAVDENDHPADQRDTLAAELELLLPDDDMLHAYEGALEGFVCADKYNARAKR